MAERDDFTALQAENARLVALLESHLNLSTADKVALFRRLFRGRTDVYPVRWEGKTSGKSGYAPACANEWRAVHVLLVHRTTAHPITRWTST